MVFLGFDTVMQAGVENILIVAKFIRNGSIICDETEIPEDFVKVKVIENGNLYSYAVKKGTKTYNLSELIVVKDKDKLKKELEQDKWFGSFKSYLSSAYLHIKRYMHYNKKIKTQRIKKKHQIIMLLIKIQIQIPQKKINLKTMLQMAI